MEIATGMIIICISEVKRSPYTNEYYPPLEGALLPSPKIRALEEKAQLLFQEYLKLYL